MKPLTFKTIDLCTHADLCIKFRLDSYVCSFTDGRERFEADSGEDGGRYLEWLRQRISDLPLGCVHAWENNRIVGQIESRLRDDGNGYVNLLYLRPGDRGFGRGQQLHAYVMNMFAAQKAGVVRLTVSAENQRALAFYQKLGWKNLGPKSEREDSLLFEYAISDK